MRVTFTAGREWRPDVSSEKIRAEHMDKTARELLEDEELAHTQWRWTLEADNGEPIATGAEGYGDKRDCIHGFGLTHRASIEPAFAGTGHGPYRAFDAETHEPLDVEILIVEVDQ